MLLKVHKIVSVFLLITRHKTMHDQKWSVQVHASHAILKDSNKRDAEWDNIDLGRENKWEKRSIENETVYC